MKKSTVLLAILLFMLVSCKNNETIISESSDIINSVIEESDPAEIKTETEPDITQSQSEIESHDDKSSTSHLEDNTGIEQSTSKTDNQKLPVYSEQALVDFLTYMQQSLTDDQHGGMHRVSDFNGSGLHLHGGPDKADPYIVIWVIDKNIVDRIIESYSEQKVDIVCVDAAYSIGQLNSIMSELQNSEISANINGIALSDDNKVIVDVIGETNQDKVNGFLQTYKYKDAISLFIRSGNGDNPTT